MVSCDASHRKVRWIFGIFYAVLISLMIYHFCCMFLKHFLRIFPTWTVSVFSPFTDVDDSYDFANTYHYTLLFLYNTSAIIPCVGFLFIYLALNPVSRQKLKRMIPCCNRENSSTMTTNENPLQDIKSDNPTVTETRSSGESDIGDDFSVIDDEELLRIVTRQTEIFQYNESRHSIFSMKENVCSIFTNYLIFKL